ncbi:MAG: stage II sporulation protein M [Erysipelotrichaceae bacterium]
MFKTKHPNIRRFILTIITCGFIFGIILGIYINTADTNILNKMIIDIGTNVSSYKYFVSEFIIGVLFVGIIFILGTSIISTPIIGFIIFYKGTQIGYTCILYIMTYQLKGIIGIIITLIPQVILDVMATYVICSCSLNLSISLLNNCISSKVLSLRSLFNRIINDAFIALTLTLLSAIFKAYILIHLIKLFCSF